VIDVVRGPEGDVLYIDWEEDQTLRLAGYCRYWIGENQIGMFGCEEHPDPPIAYRWTGRQFVREDVGPPDDVEILIGEWLEDDEWERVMR
jgi:hypothetical protein